MNVFISQPMNGLTEELIKEVRNDIFENYKKDHADAQLIDSYYTHGTEILDSSKHPRVAYLAQSIADLAEADVVLFAPGWEGAPGCRIENKVATYYDIKREYVNQVS